MEPMEPFVHFSVQLCFVIRPHTYPRPRTTAGNWGKRLCSTISAGALPGAPTYPTCCFLARCAQAVSLLCAAPSSPPNRCYAHRGPGRGDVSGLLTSPITTATLPPPPQAHEIPARPAPPALSAYSQGFRLPEVLCRCVTPVTSLVLASLCCCKRACLVQRRTPAGRRSAGRFRKLKPFPFMNNAAS